MENKTSSRKGPLIQIIEVGLGIWVRSQCKSINKIDISLGGSNYKILSGRISSVSIIAEQVNYKDLILKEVNLISGPLALNIDLSNKNQKITFREKFNVEGNISLTSKGLKEIILSTQWEWIGQWLAINLLGVSSLQSIEIDGDILKLKGSDADKDVSTKSEFDIEAKLGTLCFNNKTKDEFSLLPMDQSIHINHAIIKDDKALISLSAVVSPYS